MLSRNHTLWQSLDWSTVVLYLLLVVAGWFSICGATYSFDMDELFRWGSRPIMQLVWIGLGLVVAFAVLMVNSQLFETYAPVFYVAMLGLCLVTIFVAPDIKGSRSWLVLGPVRLQPAEFTKVATALMLAFQCSRYGFEVRSLRSYIQLMATVFAPVLLILGQSETGSALVFLSLFLALYREGFTGLFMGLGVSATFYFIAGLMLDGEIWFGGTTSADGFVICSAIVLFTLALLVIYSKRRNPHIPYILGIGVGIYLVGALVHQLLYPFDMAWLAMGVLVLLVLYLLYLWLRTMVMRYALMVLFALGSYGFFLSTSYIFDHVLEPHQQVRIKVSLGIESDPRGDGYNVEQSKIAIGSGGLWGKGFLQGTQTKLNYVPEQDTDFILCTVGEEQGFVGTSLLLIIYGVFILRLVHLSERQTWRFGRVYGYCIASIFFFHLFINVGMVIGIIPVIGIPLPFFSYGGSSLWGFSIMLFIFLGIDARRYNKHL